MLSDHPLMLDTPLLAQIQFSTEHIGPSLETRPGYWMHSTSTPRETLSLLNRLFGVGSGAAEACSCGARQGQRGGQRRYSSAGG